AKDADLLLAAGGASVLPTSPAASVAIVVSCHQKGSSSYPLEPPDGSLATGRPPPPPPPSPGPRRSFFFTSAVAHRRLGPISSAMTSIFERLSPSWLSQLRCSSRPVTITRDPRVSDSLAFSAISRQHTTSKNEV